ncbi:DUF4133 domain-containing protein [Chitinophaga sp. Ak27]|uniref:DUF4133 domain-containing protein n=1 Tax=Chitinophaga sp. Ak27 TaxID=2726116 RepID=UPI00145C9A52|nr:DUF4133 domain-containing protein [Chitinophaga sp. Ak27]NLU91385.1 DUF4133 domain-containing protein [Chitinophaga sp. Ak27]
MTGVFTINKGINKAIELKGIKAQYLAYLAAGLVGLLIVFAVCYVAGVPTYVLILGVLLLGIVLFSWVSRFSHKYGQHGLMKLAGYRQVTPAITCRTRKMFFDILKNKK